MLMRPSFHAQLLNFRHGRGRRLLRRRHLRRKRVPGPRQEADRRRQVRGHDTARRQLLGTAAVRHWS